MCLPSKLFGHPLHLLQKEVPMHFASFGFRKVGQHSRVSPPLDLLGLRKHRLLLFPSLSWPVNCFQRHRFYAFSNSDSARTSSIFPWLCLTAHSAFAYKESKLCSFGIDGCLLKGCSPTFWSPLQAVQLPQLDLLEQQWRAQCLCHQLVCCFQELRCLQAGKKFASLPSRPETALLLLQQ